MGVPGATVALLGAAYSRSLTQMPIATKSVTAAATFALSDVAAQRLQPSPDGFDGKRTLTTALIGLLYFGPSLHFYLDWVTELIPGSGMRSTLLKTLVGQLFFGPAVTCVFFGAFLVAGEGWRGLQQWPSKVRRDLLVVWGSELCFWPFVDLLCYSFVTEACHASKATPPPHRVHHLPSSLSCPVSHLSDHLHTACTSTSLTSAAHRAAGARSVDTSRLQFCELFLDHLPLPPSSTQGSLSMHTVGDGGVVQMCRCAIQVRGPKLRCKLRAAAGVSPAACASCVERLAFGACCMRDESYAHFRY